MSLIALAIIAAFAVWIAGIGMFALARPAAARARIAQFATSWQINLIEQLGRGLAGAALVIRAPDALTPAAFIWAGWAIVLSAVALLIVPLRWHSAYAVWWSRNLPLAIVRIAGIAAIAVAATMMWSAWG